MTKKKLISSELREGTGAVFLSEYPAEDDLVGWLKVHRNSDPLGIFTSKWHDKALELIESLSQHVAECERQKFNAECEREEALEKLAIALKSNEELRLKAVIADMPMSEVEEQLRQQLATMTAAYADAVEKHNKTLDELRECEQERDELITTLQVIVNTNPIYGASHDIARKALEKVGAGKTGEGS